MYLMYGSYKHEEGECIISIHKEAVVNNKSGKQYATRERWTINGRLHKSNPSLVDSAIRSLQNAYSVNDNDIGFYHANGVATSHIMKNSDSVSGIKVVSPPSFPIGNLGEFSSYRNYTIEVEGEFLFSDLGTVVSYEETVSYTGTGGMKWVSRETLNTYPVVQYIKPRTLIKVVQSGQAQGYKFYPVIPSPIWPEYEHLDQRSVEYYTSNDKYHQRNVRWSYYFSFGTYPYFPGGIIL